MNNLADALLAFLLTQYPRAYRNKAPMNPTYPYIVFKTADSNDTYPSDDVMVTINIFDLQANSVRVIESLADTIDDRLNLTVIDNTTINARFVKDIRQLVIDPDLSGVQFINIQYTARLYRKG